MAAPAMVPTNAAPTTNGEIIAPPVDNTVTPLTAEPAAPAPNSVEIPAAKDAVPAEGKSILPQENNGASRGITIDPSAFVING